MTMYIRIFNAGCTISRVDNDFFPDRFLFGAVPVPGKKYSKFLTIYWKHQRIPCFREIFPKYSSPTWDLSTFDSHA